jgi:hypothetical protein
LNGENPNITFTGRIGSVTFQEIKGVAFNGRYLFLSDELQGKVWMWNGLPNAASPAEPILTLQMNRPGRLFSDGTYFVITSTESAEIRIYRIADLVAGTTTPTKVLSRFVLNLPMHAITFDGRLAVANTVNNAVYVWERVEDAGDYQKAVILGADSLMEFKPEIGRNKLFWPASLCFDGKYLWVGEFKFSIRILRFRPAAATAVESEPQVLTTFALFQNYPNPFNATTIITFRVPSVPALRNYSAFATLKAFDILGREVATLVNGELNSGEHQVVFDAKGLASGVYFYRLSTPTFSQTKTMVVIK